MEVFFLKKYKVMNARHSGFHHVLSQYVIDILWEFYCFSFGHKREKQEKATDDRQRSGKYERNLSARKVFHFFLAKIFFLQKTWHYLSTWDAPHMWLHHGVHLLADMKAAISDNLIKTAT